MEIVKVKQFIVSILNYIPEDYRLHKGDEQNTFLYSGVVGDVQHSLFLDHFSAPLMSTTTETRKSGR